GAHDAWHFPGTFVANPFDRLETVRLLRTAAYRRARPPDNPDSVEWAERMYRPGTEAFEVLVRVLAGFAEKVRANGAAPIVVVHPSRAAFVAERDGAPRPHAALLGALQQRDIPTIDLTDPLFGEARRAGLADVVRDHYTPLG